VVESVPSDDTCAITASTETRLSKETVAASASIFMEITFVFAIVFAIAFYPQCDRKHLKDYPSAR
jgi:hypothetical protein